MAKEKEVKTEQPVVEENKIEEPSLGNPIGVLFDTMNYYKNEDLDLFVNIGSFFFSHNQNYNSIYNNCLFI